jgi:hypothetical protein
MISTFLRNLSLVEEAIGMLGTTASSTGWEFRVRKNSIHRRERFGAFFFLPLVFPYSLIYEPI